MKRFWIVAAVVSTAVFAYADTAHAAVDDAFIRALLIALGALMAFIGAGIWYTLRQIHARLDAQAHALDAVFSRIRKAEKKADRVEAQHQIAVEAGKCPALGKLAEVCGAT